MGRGAGTTSPQAAAGELPITLEITPQHATAGNPDETWLGTDRKAQEVGLGDPEMEKRIDSRRVPAQCHDYPSTCTSLKNKPHERRGSPKGARRSGGRM